MFVFVCVSVRICLRYVFEVEVLQRKPWKESQGRQWKLRRRELALYIVCAPSRVVLCCIPISLDAKHCILCVRFLVLCCMYIVCALWR